MTQQSIEDVEEKPGDALREKRVVFLKASHNVMLSSWLTMGKNTKLDPQRVRRTVDEYMAELETIKRRDNIPHLAQRHKVAGLMTVAIVRNKPLVDCVTGDFEGIDNFGTSKLNELFAVYHGVAICGEDHGENARKLISLPQFNHWVDKFAILLERGSVSPESIIHTFETLCLGFFQGNLSH